MRGDMTSAPHFDIDPEQFWRDPYPDLAIMRATAPIAYVPQLGATLITTRNDISACEKNIQVFSSDQPGGLMNVLMGQNMMRRDGADHQAERKVYYPATAPNAVREVWATLPAKDLEAFSAFSKGLAERLEDYAERHR